MMHVLVKLAILVQPKWTSIWLMSSIVRPSRSKLSGKVTVLAVVSPAGDAMSRELVQLSPYRERWLRYYLSHWLLSLIFRMNESYVLLMCVGIASRTLSNVWHVAWCTNYK